MVFEFKFPDVGEGITEGELVKWLVAEGDSVKVDQHICEVETDKAVVEMPSPKEGKIQKLLFKEGDTIKVGEVFVLIDDGSQGEPSSKEASPEKPAPERKKEEGEKYTGSVVGFLEEAKEISPVQQSTSMPSQPERKRVKATLMVRKLAKEKGVDITTLQGTGPDGRITKEDVEKAPQGSSQAQPAPSQPVQSTEKPAHSGGVHTKKYDMFGYVERQPLKGIRKKAAEAMTKSHAQIPPVTNHQEADVTELEILRKHEKEALKAENIKVTSLTYVIKAVTDALQKHPLLNAILEGDMVVMKKYYNIGFAVGTENGLMVPVIKRTNTKNTKEIAAELQKLADEAKSRKINLMDLKGASFSITNIGGMGNVEYFTPIINPPEVAILGIGRTQEKAVVKDGKIEIRKMMPLSLTFDHRVVDGVAATLFMEDVVKNLENASSLGK